ncbi:MAG: 3-deoxy-D-manno-octulosonic acid transferase [Holosporales bacterium]|nr:3-deoxy-D-manno-octulosonic acid transferase [Holosporales bacterium]
MKSHKHDDLDKRLKNHCGIATAARPSGRLIWMHAASVGETLSAITLFKHLKKIGIASKVLLTTSTSTASRLLDSLNRTEPTLTDCCIHQYAPLDVYRWCKRFIRYWRPDCSLFFESELWPNLMRATYCDKIKLGLVNARMSDKGAKTWDIFPKTIAKILRRFSVIVAQSEYDRKKIQNLVKSQVLYFGNLKHASDSLPVNQETLDKIKAKVTGKAVFIAASTHHGEEEVVISACKRLRQKHDVFTILAPRHPKRGGEIEAMCIEAEIKCLRRSQVGDEMDADTELYLVDTIGELGTFYALADIALVGGSLIPRGGHNMLEPAKLRCSVMYGPYMYHFKELDQAFRNASAATVVNNAEELVNRITEQIEDKNKLALMQEAAYKIATAQNQILEKVTEALQIVLSPK